MSSVERRLDAIDRRLGAIEDQMARHFADTHRHLTQILTNQEKIMNNLDEILADVADESTKLDSLGTFIAGLKQQIADALSGATLPPAVQAKIDAVFAGVEANKAKVQAALDANVPTT